MNVRPRESCTDVLDLKLEDVPANLAVRVQACLVSLHHLPGGLQGCAEVPEDQPASYAGLLVGSAPHSDKGSQSWGQLNGFCLYPSAAMC